MLNGSFASVVLYSVTVLKSDAQSGIFQFGAFEVDLTSGELRKHGIRLQLQEQPFRILTALLERPGEIVTREELVTRLWPAGTFVNFDRSLNAAVGRLRQILGDSADTPRFVETVARRGYRFLGPVVSAQAPLTTGEVEAKGASMPRRASWLSWLTASVLVAVALSLALLFHYAPRERVTPVLIRLTTDAGLTTDPAVSPDGSMLAYVSDRGSQHLNLWVQQMAGGTAVQLTHSAADVRSPSFSPDGKKLVYRSEEQGGTLFVIPTLGGASRLLASEGRDPRYSPDGKWIAYWSGDPMGAEPDSAPRGRVFVIGSDGGVSRQLGSELPSVGYPIWSTDSRQIVVTTDPHHSIERSSPDWYIVPMNGGHPVQTHAFEKLSALGMVVESVSSEPRVSSWRADNILFSAKLGDSVNIWSARLRPDGNFDRVVRQTSGTNFEVAPSVDSRGRLTFSSLVRNVSLYMLRGDSDRASFGGLERLTDRSGLDFMPSLSDDGRFLVFTCGKEAAICLKDLRSGEQRTLTDGPHWNPRISHDGSRIAYTTGASGAMPLNMITATGGPSARIIDGGGWAFGWFHDNRRVSYRRSYSREIDVVDVLTRRADHFAARNGSSVYQAEPAPDDSWVSLEVVSDKSEQSRIYIAPVGAGVVGREETWIPIGFSEGWDDKPRWAPSGKLIYFISQHDGWRCLWAQRVDEHTRRPIAEPFAVFHFHNVRLNLMNLGMAVTELGVGADKIVLNLCELSGNIWASTPR
jgi:eukaryotic-like serine/threonine-protein kinase